MEISNVILTGIAVLSAVGSIVNTIIQSRKATSEKAEIEANITQKLQQVYDGIINAMQKRIDELESQIDELQKTGNDWRASFYELIVIVEKFGCSKKCDVRDKIQDLLANKNKTK